VRSLTGTHRRAALTSEAKLDRAGSSVCGGMTYQRSISAAADVRDGDTTGERTPFRVGTGGRSSWTLPPSPGAHLSLLTTRTVAWTTPWIGLPPAGGLLVNRHTVGRRTVLRVSGEVDIGTVGALRSAVEAALESGAHELWIDLTPTCFMDSTGLHLLIDGSVKMRKLSRRMAIVCPAGPVRRLFDVAGVTGILPLYDDLAAAHRHA
jgi:anti-sigma B factor antagonist